MNKGLEIDSSSIEDLQYKLGKCLVIGGSGWLGSYLVHHLLQLSHSSIGNPNIVIHSADIIEPLEELKMLHQSSDIIHHLIDIRDRIEVKELMYKIKPNIVFHLASCIDLRSVPSPDLEDVNVNGTKNLLEESSLLENFDGDNGNISSDLLSDIFRSIRFVVYTSSIDVVSEKYGIKDANEKSPYSKSPSNDYKRTKIQAEKLALSYNKTSTAESNNYNSSYSKSIRTCALRPAHIFGPADRVMKLASEFPVAVGYSGARMSFIYVENCARGHVLAAAAMMREALLEKKEKKDGNTETSDSTDRSELIPACTLTDANICGCPLFLYDFEANFCDFYKCLGNKSPCKIRIPVALLSLVLEIVIILEKLAFNLFGIYLQHPITGISSGVLEACGHLTIKSSLAASKISYIPTKSASFKFSLLDQNECILRTMQFHETGVISTNLI